MQFPIRKLLNLRRLYSGVVDKTCGLRCDQIVAPTGFYSKKDYPEKLRRIKFFDDEQKRHFVFLTNHLQVASVDRCRTLPIPLESGAFLQMDQAASADQSLLRDFGNGGKDPDLDCDFGLRSGGDPEKADANSAEPLHNSTDFEFDLF